MKITYQIELSYTNEWNRYYTFNGNKFIHNKVGFDDELPIHNFNTKEEATAEAKKQVKVFRDGINFDVWGFLLEDFHIQVLKVETDKDGYEEYTEIETIFIQE